MDNFYPARRDNPTESAARDLARRLERYRSRVAAEGRPRSVRLIDRAIEDAENKPGGDQ